MPSPEIVHSNEMLCNVDIAQQIKGFDHRQIPPELRALPEDDPDFANSGNTILPRHAAKNFAMPGVRHQNPGERLDRGGFSSAI